MIRILLSGWAVVCISLLAVFAAHAHTPNPGVRTIQVQASPIPLDPLTPAENTIGELTYIGGLVLSSTVSEFGGFSGLDISEDGERLTAVSDRGYWMTARILTEGAVPKGLADVRLAPLLTPTRLPVQGNWSDAEGLVRSPDGRLLVSFERRHRVWSYDVETDGFQALPEAIKLPREVKDIRFNKGLESLAYLEDGRFLMLTEQTFDVRGRLIGWLETKHGFNEIFVQPSGRFHITDMARLPGGDILLLERRFTIIGGPGMQLRRIAKESVKPGQVLDGPVIARLGSSYNIDNMEGLAVRPNPGGGSYLYMISDDNFSEAQRTLLLVFQLP